MGIIFKLTLRYLKKNKKRTRATILGIACTMIILTTISLFANTLMGMIRESIREDQGSWHLIFHDLDQEQYESLKENKKLCNVSETECEDCEPDAGLCVAAEMKNVSWRMFARTQKIGKKIGMEQLPEEEWRRLPYRETGKYNITYHIELLEYYGLNDETSMSVGGIINVIVTMVMLMGCVLIYNAYSISTFEKLRYLGTLGSIGASKFQRISVVYWEGILEGLVGIPVGIGAGILLTNGIVKWLENIFMYEQPLVVELTFGRIVTFVLWGFLMIFLACLFPAWKAVHTSSMELITQTYEVDTKMRTRTNPLKKRKLLGTVGMLAFKNMWVRRKSYIANSVLLILTFCVILDGMAVMRGINKEYYPVDDREREELDLWTELYTMDDDKIMEFYEKVAALPEVTSISLERNMSISDMLLEPGEIQDDLQKVPFEVSEETGFWWHDEPSQLKSFQDMKSGNWIEGIHLRTVIVGVDDQTFQAYVKKAGYEIPEDTTEEYEVLIEDHEEVRTLEKICQRSILKAQPDSEFTFWYSRYGDIGIFTGTYDNQRDEMRKGNFRLIGTTQETPPYPYYSGKQDDINGYQEETLGFCHIYMSMDDFERLLEDPMYSDIYKKHPEDTYAFHYPTYNSVATYLKFNIQREEEEEEHTFWDFLFGMDGLSTRIQEDARIKGKIEIIAQEVRLKKGAPLTYDPAVSFDEVDISKRDSYFFNSQALWQKNEYFRSQKFLLLILGYGLMALITLLSLTNIFQSISTSMRMRRKEFAAYQSIGMSQKDLKRMLSIEAGFYGIIGCVIGIPVSFLGLLGVYDTYHEVFYNITWKIPWDMVPIQIVVAILLLIVPVRYAMSQLKHLNIIESIRNDNQ